MAQRRRSGATLAIGFRASNSLALAGAYAGLLLYGLSAGWKLREVAGVVISGLAAAILGALFFLTSWILSHHTTAFLTLGIGPAAMWTLKMHVGGFMYKVIYLFGPIATCILLFLLACNRKPSKLSSMNANAGRGFAIFLGAFSGNIVIFVKFPLKVSYLPPRMVFFLLVAGISFLSSSRMGIVASLCGIIVFNFFSVSFTKPDIPLHATGAKLTFSPRSGVLVEGIRIFLKAKRCDSAPCWAKYAQEQTEL